MALTRIRAQQISNIDYKQAVRVVTVENVTLSGGAPSTVDGVNLQANDRILVNGQSPAAQNGLYRVSTLGTGSNGTWVRTTDADQNGEVEPGMVVMVTEGDSYADTPWKLTTNGEIIIGTTPLSFSQFAGGSGVPGGANTQIQFNDSGNFAGSSSLTWTGDRLSVGANIIPQANITYDLGNATNRWNDIWLANSTIYLGNAQISANATSLIFTNPQGAQTVLSGTTANILASAVTVTGNITGGNLTTTGVITAIGNVSGGNVTTVGQISATGNITGGNLLINNNAVITGNLNVLGTETIFNVQTLTVNDLDIIVANNVTGGANINGAGILAGNPTTASFIYNNATSSWQVNVAVTPNANGTLDLGKTGSRWGNAWVSTLTSTGNANVGNIGATNAVLVGALSGATTISASGNANVGNIGATNGVFTNISGTLTTASQPNITSIGTLSSLTVTGNVSTGNISGTLITGTLATASQPNVTSLGTLSSLTVTGNVSGGNLTTAGQITATGNISGNFFIGNGSQLTGISTSTTRIFNGTSEVNIGSSNGNANVTIGATANVAVFSAAGLSIAGTLNSSGNANVGNIGATNGQFTNISGTLTTAAQPNITSVGNLTSLIVTGNSSGGNFNTAGAVVVSGSEAATSTATGSIRTAGGIGAAGNVYAGAFYGAATGLTSVPGANVTGTVPNANNSAFLNSISAVNLYNNMGNTHTTRTAFDATTPSYGFGYRFVQGNTNGPGVNSAAQYYSWYIGLGSDYAATGSGSYGCMFALPRNVSVPYMAVRYNENNSFGAWQKIAAGYADSAGTAGTVTTAAQANITSVGTLTTLSVTGNVTIGTGSGGNITGANVITATTITATGNVTGGNLITAGLVSLSSITKTGSNGVGNIGSSTSTFNTVFAKSTSAQYADLAEKYQADQSYSPGTVVIFGGQAEVTADHMDHDVRAAGVISTDPAYIMNAGLQGLHVVEVALSGRVPCLVIGPVNKGDRIVCSHVPGVGRVLDTAKYEPGCIIGKSLQSSQDTGIKLLEIVVGRI
jgi:hypothetical protein